ncbi:hypothetical protein G9A89_011587 [Geosiphon pyriformis]|nr:hypothetical protein G9A89_011587 [Geosiphon pyriformis]
MRVCYYCELLTYDTAATLSTTSISNANLSTNKTSKLSAAATIHLSATISGNISAPTNSNTTTELTSKWNLKAEIDPTKLEIIDSILPHNQQDLDNEIWALNVQPNNLETNQHPTLISNILLATITENKSLDVIFPFEFEELSTTPLFSGAALEEKPITVMYTDAKVDGHSIKLILDIDCAVSTRIITTDETTKTSIGKIDDFPFEVNGIIIPIKVLVIEATQYQALVGNNWLSKTNTILDWMMQKLQLSQNSQYICVPAICGYFKTTNSTTPLIEFEEDKEKPTWKWEETNKGKKKKKEEETTLINNTYSLYAYTSSQPSNYCQPKLECVNCSKKLSLMGACYGNNKEYWDNQPCLTCETILSDEEIWNDILGQEEMCDKTCQYTILINDWVRKRTPINDTWKRAL